MNKSFLATLLTTISLTAPHVVWSDIFHSGTGAVDGFLCVGVECNDYSVASGRTLVLKEDSVQLVFEDDSDAPFPSNDWEITINDSSSSGENYFQVRDVTGNRNPFRIAAGAPTNSLWLDTQGDLGVGLPIAEAPIHVRRSLDSWIRFETTSSGGYEWDVLGNSTNFIIRDAPNNRLPFRLFPGVANGMLAMNPTGVGINTNDGLGSVNIRAPLDVRGKALVDGDLEVTSDVGIGTDAPDAPLHVLRSDNTATLLIEETGAGTLGQMILRNNGTTFFSLEDTSITAGDFSGRIWNFQNNNGTFRITTAPGGAEMLMTAQGDMTISGELTTAGSCSVGCDRVFDVDYALPSIAEHNAAMWQNGYLPNVGPTPENGPFNVSDKMGRMLNELEHAHIFIGQQQSQINAQEDRIAALEAKLEAMLSK